MRHRRRSPPTIIEIKWMVIGLLFPALISCQTYDAVPIGRPFLRPPPSPRQEEAPAPTLARGYQPPPRPSQFQPPRSYQQPSLNLGNRGPQFNWQMQQLQQQHPQRFQPPQGRRTVPQGPQQLDPVNNIIIHLYLNAKDRMPSHAEIKTPVRGLFGIGTSHGGPGSHSDPIVITKDFDRETLEFVDEGQAKVIIKISGPSNIIEVKATVSTPNRQLENTVNHAVNQELDRAIPKVMDRMRGSTMTMDNGMRKELEEALVDEVWTTRTTTQAAPTRAPPTQAPPTQTTRASPTQAPPTQAPPTHPTTGHVHVVPGIRVTESTTEATKTTQTTKTTTPTTTTTKTTKTTKTTTPTTTTTTQAPPRTWAPWTPPTTTTTTVPPYHPPTAVTRPPEFNLPTKRPMIEVSPSIGPIHHGIVNLESNEEDYESTVTSRPIAMFTTERSTAIHNLPTKPSSVQTLHPSTFSPPLVTDTEEPFTFSLDTSPDDVTTVPITTVSTTSTVSTTTTASTVIHHETSDVTQEPTVTPSPPEETTVTPVPTTVRRYTVEQKIEVPPHTIYTEEPFFSTSSIEWNPTTSAEDYSIPTTTTVRSVIREDEDYDYTNEFAILPATVTTTIASTSTNQTVKPFHRTSSSEEIQPNFVIPSGQCPTPNRPDLDRNRTDLLFLLDSSDNFNEQRFHRAIALIKDTVAKFENFGPDGMQVSLVQYNDEPYLEFSLRKHNCKKHLLDDIADTEFMTGDRPDAENILIIVTDGQSSGRIQEPTRLAKENNVTVLVISTIEADEQFVNELSGNKAENLFGLDSNDDLSWKLANRISGSSQAPPPSHSEILRPVLPEIPENNGLVTRRPENVQETSGIINLECVGDGFKIQVNPPDGFRGVAVVKGYQDDARCKATAHPSTPLNLFISNEECGVTQVKSSDPRGLNSSLVLHLLHENDLNTGEDRAYLLQCFIGSPPDEDAVLSTNLDLIRSELAIAETISLSTLPPTCTYSIRKDGPEGPVVNKAVVGQTVWHRWECDGTNETTQAYGIQIHSCYASDDVERKFAFVDPRGCSSDLALLTDLSYADDSLTAWAASHVFNVHDAESLKFVCKLSLCTRDGDGCEGVTPPSCGTSNKSGLLLTKRLTKGVNSVDEALTSALSTNVKLSSSGSSDGLEDFLKSAVSSYLFWIVALVAVAAIVAVSLLSRNVAENAETATTCSDPTTMSQDCGGSIRSISSPTPPNPRLADFMRNFDRNRYV
uniref:SEA domain-containing protein n=1 Tax=Caenorhabditis tropicalis TaxID=1561998 RepID=A0A1I7UM86_9PELO